MTKTHYLLTMAALLSAGPALSVDVNLTAADGFGNSSFNSAGAWSNALPPAAGNDYFNNGLLMRTPGGSDANWTFAGDSLTITGSATYGAVNNEALMWKGIGTTSVITVDDLIVNGGQLRHGQGDGDAFTLAGNITVGPNGMGLGAQGGFTITAPISGNSSIVVMDATGTATRMITFASPASTFTGDLVLNATRSYATLADNAVFNFVLGAAGTSNEIRGTGQLTLNGDFVLDLSGASTTSGSSWPLVSVANRTYGESFTVAGFTSNGAIPGTRLWSLENEGVTYQFNEATGAVAVVGVDADGDGMDDDFEQLIIDASATFTMIEQVLPGDDYDGDGDTNAAEFAAGSDPTDADSTTEDTDADQMDDEWEITYFTDLSRDGTLDNDEDGGPDGLTDLQEFEEGTDPTDSDTDDDGLSDGDEVNGTLNPFAGAPTDPTEADSDNDDLSDSDEINGVLNTFGPNDPTDPNVADSDVDGANDGRELRYGSNPNDDTSLPDVWTLIGPNWRNGGFELVNGQPGEGAGTYDGIGWDDETFDIDNWQEWSNPGTPTGGLSPAADFNGFGNLVASIVNNNSSTFNMTSYVAKEGDVIEISFFKTQGDVGFSTVSLVVPDGAGGATVVSDLTVGAFGASNVNPRTFNYIVTAGDAAVGKTIGVGIRGDGAPKIDNVTLTVQDQDTDGDGLSDFWEERYFAVAAGGVVDDMPTQAELDYAKGSSSQGLPGNADPDGDGSDNLTEQAAGSDPTNSASSGTDVDGDGLDDGWEVDYFDSIEAQSGTDDYDGDFANNFAEQDASTYPDEAGDWPDDDGDDMSDGWEMANGLVVGTDDSGLDADSDGATNKEEHDAGSDPQNAAWTPTTPLLAHRWSFNGDLTDSVGDSDAEIVDADGNAATGGGSTLSGGSVTLSGGANAESDFVSLGGNLLQGKKTPVSIELWATQVSVQNWSRIFSFNQGTGASPLFMSWSFDVNPNNDRVEWAGDGDTTIDGSNAPYTLGTEYHIVMTLTPAFNTMNDEFDLFTGTRVSWQVSSASDATRGYFAQGTFDSPRTLENFNDINNWLGRSIFAGDLTANASYNEVRIYDGSLEGPAMVANSLAGPDDAVPLLDIDDDGLFDSWEISYFGDYTSQNGSSQVGDTDGANLADEHAAGSNPTDSASVPGDIDGDGLDDVDFEFFYFGGLNDPDGAPDADPDGDYDTNLVEQANETDPLFQDDFYSASGDAVPDSWKAAFGIETQTADDDLDEGSGDGLINEDEFYAGTDPTDKDSDDDGLSDGDEISGDLNTFGPNDPTDPLVADSDDDGLNDGDEVTNATNPNVADTDGDGFTDSYELANGGNPTDGGIAPTQPAGFTLFEDFEGEGMVVGQTFNGVNGWTAGGLSTVVLDPTDTGNQVGSFAGDADVHRPLVNGAVIQEGNTGTFFFQAYVPAGSNLDRAFVLSDTNGVYFEGDVNIGFNGRSNAGQNRINGRNPGVAYTNYQYPTGQWMNIWLVANNATDRYDMYVDTPTGQTGRVQLADDWTFRNSGAGLQANALISFVMGQFDDNADLTLIDNLYVDPVSENLENPVPEDVFTDTDNDGMEDSWETTYGLTVGVDDSLDDLDGDGTNNLCEFKTGLDPTDGSSRFVSMSSDTDPSDGFTFSFPSKAGTTFTIRRYLDLVTVDEVWTGVAAAGGAAATTSFTDDSAPSDSAFYVVEPD